MDFVETNGNIFEDLGFEQDVAENLKHRAMLMSEISKYIKENSLTQSKAAKLFEVSQPRISDLIRGHIDKFTIDMLINMLSRMGKRVSISLEDRAA